MRKDKILRIYIFISLQEYKLRAIVESLLKSIARAVDILQGLAILFFGHKLFIHIHNKS